MRQEHTELCARSQEKLAIQSRLSTASCAAIWSLSASRRKELRIWQRLIRTNVSFGRSGCSGDILNTRFHSYEKQTAVAPPVSRQNDRLYATTGIRKKQLPADRLLCKRSTFSRSVMVAVGVSLLGRTDLVFIDPGVKINGSYYQDNNFCQPFVRSVSGDFFTFQQDNAPGAGAHRARETVAVHCFQLRHPTSSVHSTGHRTARTSIRLFTRLRHFARASLPLPDPWRRPSDRTTDCRMAPIWPEHHWQSCQPVAGATAWVCQRERRTLWASNLNDQTI